MRSTERGFTLIEVMVVIAIAMILVTLAAPNIAGLYRRMALQAEGRRLYGAVVEAQGLATSTGRVHQLLVDRTTATWQIREDSNGDGTFDRLIKQHPQGTDSWPAHVAYGPQNGVSAAFPTPYNTVTYSAWCTPCGASATSGEIRFDVDGRIRDSSDAILPSGVIMLHDTTPSSGNMVQAMVFFGATGDVRLLAVQP